MILYAISVRASGGAIVAVDHGTSPPLPIAIERLPSDLGAVALHVRTLAERGCSVVIDLDGRGESLRRLLGRRPGWRWYDKTGRARRELTDTLDAAASQPGFRFDASLGQRDEMRRALEGLRKSVDEDGSPENEYAVAAALALIRPSPPRVY